MLPDRVVMAAASPTAVEVFDGNGGLRPRPCESLVAISRPVWDSEAGKMVGGIGVGVVGEQHRGQAPIWRGAFRRGLQSPGLATDLRTK
jgi:hypothetical protein